MRLLMSITLSAALLLAAQTPSHARDELIVKPSPHTVKETLDRLSTVLKSKGATVFARIDHAAGADKVKMKLRPTQVLIFGNPKLGTPLMTADQRIGLALPLKVLCWQDRDGKVWLSYRKPGDLKAAYDIKERDKVFGKITGILDKLTNAALK